MKLRKVRLQNYRNHADSTLDLTDVSFAILRGANASGKSSLGQAISVSLCETTMGLGADGTGFRSKIKDGEKTATIITEIQGQHILEKTVTLSVGAAGRTQVVKCLDLPDDKKIVNGFENFLTRYNDALKIALNTDHFSRTSEKDQKNLLAKLVLPARYEFPKDKQLAVHEAIGANQIDFDGEPFSVIESAYKKLYKERETVNRQVKEFTIPEALLIPKGVDSESLQKLLTEIRAQREKLQKERDAAVAKANEIEVKRATLQTTRENLLKKRDEDQKKLATVEPNILSDDDVAKLKAVEAKAGELANLKKQHTAYLGGIQAVDEQIDRLKGISEKGATCPTCDQNIDSEKIESLIADLQKEIAEADKKLQELDTKIEAIGDVDAAKASIKKHEDAVRAKAEINASLMKTVEEGKKTRAALDALVEKIDATLPFNDPLGILQAKEDKIVEQLRPVITAEERAKDIAKKKVEFEKLEAKAKTLQELVVYFDKDGVKAKLIADHIGSFESKINSILARFGYKAMFGSDMEFKVTTKRGYTGPIGELSKAERQMFYPAFQCAVSIAAGIKLAVIDDMDTYLRETGMRNDMYTSLYELLKDGSLEQIIIVEASTDNKLPDPQAKWSRYFWVEDGTVEVLG
jgi:chromosome segregation ATPase